MWVAALAYVVLASGTAATRRPIGDEGELASPAYTLAHRGYLAVTQWGQHRDSYKAYWMQYSRPVHVHLHQAVATNVNIMTKRILRVIELMTKK